ncbi:hypothetical protein ACH5RR_003770 [Cinchona calisaya]|uniref:Transmembrane protein n=1 Tax=Cinchona calisaya TaxID=153742 RepID=A0ABD3AWE1_9GENT
MEFLEVLSSVAVILDESIKLLPKNGKLVALITTFSLLLLSASFLIFSFSSKFLLDDMLAKQSSFTTSSSSNPADYTTILSSIMEDFRLVVVVNVSYVLSTFIIKLFPETAIVILSAMSYTGKTLSFKELLLKVIRSWIRPFVTGFFTTLFAVGYFFFATAVASPMLVFSGTFFRPIAILIGGIAYVFSLYLSVVWVMALVISVIEENCYGIKALGKAEALVKGKKLDGFIINIGFNLISLILFQGFRSIIGEKWMGTHMTVFWLLLVNWSCLQMIFLLVTYTVLYFHCKKHHGEEVELLQGSFSYSKLSTASPFNNAVP